MKSLIVSLLLLSSTVYGETFIVEMKRPLAETELEQARQNKMKVELFDKTPTDYFKRTYRVEARTEAAVKNNFPTVTIEQVYRAQHFSLEPSSSPQFLRKDSLFHFQWGLHNAGQKIKRLINNTKETVTPGRSGSDIRWSESIKKIEAGLKKEPLVAVVDMGLDLDHPEIKTRIFKNTIECNDKGEVEDTDLDKDNNGLVGDCMGWNFAARSMQEARRPYDDNGHGTHVSGIIAAESNLEGITGVSSKIKILPIKVTGTIDESSDRKSVQPLTDRIAKGILYATNMGADVINLSLGWTRSMDTKYLNEAINYALSRNVIIVAAAGNNNNNANIFPCSHYDVICVGAATIDGTVADFSNYGGEVDILAPGDEIISIIPTQIVPLQMNLQGFDIRSGTSQATPFVSAAAALLRGNYPRMNRDEVIRRILDSADPGIPGKSLGGMLNLKGAFEIASLPSVKPIFKKFAVALYDGPTKNFLYPLLVKNFGAETKDLVIKIRSLSDAFNLSQEFAVPLIRPGEVINLKLQGEITNVDAHNMIKLQVTISGKEIESKSFEHEFRVAKDVLREQTIKTMGFSFEAENLPVATYKDGEVRNLINTVETLSPEVGVPEYYLPRTLKEKKSIVVKFFRQSDYKIQEVKGAATISEAIQLLNVTRLDLNYDGEMDYLIRAIACDKNCDVPGKEARYIQYSLWDKNLRPLLGEKSFWKFLPIMVNVDIKSQRFVKVKTKDFGELAVPAFLESGVVPLNQQTPLPFTKPDTSVVRRVYYLDPVMNQEGRVELLTKTFMTTDFLKSLKEELQVPSFTEVQSMHLLSQSRGDLASGEINVVLSVGLGYLRKNYVVKFGTSQKSSAQSYSITQNILGYEHLKAIDLTTQDYSDSFNGLISRSRLMMFQKSQNGYGYSSKDSVEAPIGVISSFSDQDAEYTFFQTPSYLMLAHKDSVGVSLSKLKINRFSFLPGTLFNDTFYPVLTQVGGEMSPGLYVDETDIQSNIVSFTVFQDGELRSPIKQSSFIPPICKALNPVRFKADEGHSLTMICLENKSFVMKFIDLSL